MAFEIFDDLFPKEKAAELPDLYVEDLEKVTFVIDGVEKTFVGGMWKDVPFFVKAHNLKTGRRLVVDNLPNADANITQDLGRKTRGVTFTAYLLGADVFTQKMKMIDAMEAGGVSDLVHPYFGKLKAEAGDLDLTETDIEKQYVTMTLSFVIKNDSITGKQSTNKAKALDKTVEDSNSSILDAFEAAFDVLDKAGAVVDAANDIVSAGLDSVAAARNSMRSVALFVEKFKKLKTNLGILLGSPRSLAEQFLDLITFVDDDDPNPNFRERQDEAINMAKFTAETPNTATQSGSDLQIAQNDNALSSLIKQVASGVAASAVPSIEFESVDAAAENIAVLVDMFDDAQVNAIDDVAYYDSLSMQTQATDFISDISQNLAIVETIELSHSTTVLTLAYELDGNLDNFADIISRNSIQDPFFIPPDVLLEVLRRDS